MLPAKIGQVLEVIRTEDRNAARRRATKRRTAKRHTLPKQRQRTRTPSCSTSWRVASASMRAIRSSASASAWGSKVEKYGTAPLCRAATQAQADAAPNRKLDTEIPPMNASSW